MLQKELPKLVCWTPNELVLVTNSNLKHKMTENHKEQFRKSMYSFRHVPILNRTNASVPLNDSIDLNLMTFNVDANLNAQGEMIVSNVSPKNTLPVPENTHGKARKFEGCFFTALDGSMLQQLTTNTRHHLHGNVDPDTPLPVQF